jgi:hypothetical protein
MATGYKSLARPTNRSQVPHVKLLHVLNVRPKKQRDGGRAALTAQFQHTCAEIALSLERSASASQATRKSTAGRWLCAACVPISWLQWTVLALLSVGAKSISCFSIWRTSVLAVCVNRLADIAWQAAECCSGCATRYLWFNNHFNDPVREFKLLRGAAS